MPILTADYISTWYHFADITGNDMIFESWKENQERQTEQMKFIQGDIGTHVMNVGGMKWITEISGPALISSEVKLTPLDVVFTCLNTISNNGISSYLLKEANIQFDEKAVRCNASFWSDYPNIFIPLTTAINNNWTARVAKYYDTSITMSDLVSYLILEGSIKINVDVAENYFVGGSQAATFAVQGYQISGDLKLAAPITDSNLFINGQLPAFLSADNTMIQLNVGTQYLLFPQSPSNGTPIMYKQVERNAQTDEISTISVHFESYAHPPV